MKYVIYSALYLTLLSCSNEDVKISVTDSDDEYEFYAKYDKAKTRRIQEYINAKMAPSTSVEGDNIDISTKLDDNTQFELEEYAGKVRIKLDKEANSVASYQRVKAIGEGIKQIIQEK